MLRLMPETLFLGSFLCLPGIFSFLFCPVIFYYQVTRVLKSEIFYLWFDDFYFALKLPSREYQSVNQSISVLELFLLHYSPTDSNNAVQLMVHYATQRHP